MESINRCVTLMFFMIALVPKKIGGEICSNGSLKDFTADFKVLKSESGRPIGNKLSSLTAGPWGPMLLQDMVYIEEIAHFDRERIPNRVVHGKGNGAFGYFEVTDDITFYTKAKMFDTLGKKTPIAVRFSLSSAEVGSADTSRDFRGMSVKFYTEEGNLDLVGLNIPVFVIRDPLLLPGLSRTLLPNPVSHLRLIQTSFWDFVSLRPETLAAVILVNGDAGIPESYRHMHGYAINTFKLVNAAGTAVYCKFTFLTDQGIRNMTTERAREVVDQDLFGRDLFEAIEAGDYPSWTFFIQVMTFEEADRVDFNPFDPTKEWPQEAFPFIRAGRLVLDKNPKDYFAEIEQIALSPSNMINGIEASPDKVLQSRIFCYPDTQRYRLGANYNHLPVNCPFQSLPNNYLRNGQMVYSRNQGFPNYYPSSFNGPEQDPAARESTFEVCGVAARHDSSEDDNFSQPRLYYNRMDEGEKGRLVQNLVESIQTVPRFIQDRLVANFRNVHPDLAERIMGSLPSNMTEN